MSLVKHSQRKHLLAAHRIIHKQLGEEELAKEQLLLLLLVKRGKAVKPPTNKITRNVLLTYYDTRVYYSA